MCICDKEDSVCVCVCVCLQECGVYVLEMDLFVHLMWAACAHDVSIWGIVICILV